MDKLDAALAYAARGWPVFPLIIGGKRPLYRNPHGFDDPKRETCRGECGQDGHGVLDATFSPDTIRRWWRQHPRANVGIACGTPGPDVVDFDITNGKPGIETLRKLSQWGYLTGASTIVRTPSGGTHLYYIGTEQTNGHIPASGVDFRSKGGYVAAPPSTTPAGGYIMAAERHAIGTVDWAAIKKRLQPPRVHLVPSGTWAGGGNFQSLINYVAGRFEGSRNETLFWAALVALEKGAPQKVLGDLIEVSIATGLSPREAETTVASARRHFARGGTHRVRP